MLQCLDEEQIKFVKMVLKLKTTYTLAGIFKPTVKMICQEDPSRFPWQCATERMARIHCKFLAVNITGPWWADVGKDAVGKGVPKK